MKKLKRLFITLVAVLMVLTYAPTKVRADGNVAKIGDTEYPTLAEAVSAATNGDTITLLQNVDFSTAEAEAWSKNFNLDLNGKTIARTATTGNWKTSTIVYGDSGTRNVTISNGNVNSGVGTGVYIADGTTATLSNLNVTQGYNSSGNHSTLEYSSAIRLTEESNVTVESGTYTGLYAIVVSNSGGNIVVNGGTFNGDLYFADYTSPAGAKKTITINNGYFNGNFANTNKGTLTIKGGYFTADPTSYLASNDYKVVASNVAGYNYKVVEKDYVAQVDSTKYESLDAAVTAATADQTVKLLKDVTYDASHAVALWNKGITFDLNGKTLTTNGSTGTYQTSAICFSNTTSHVTNAVVKNGTVTTAYGTGVYLADGTTGILENLTITAATTGAQSNDKEYSSAVRLTEESNVTVKSGTYTAQNGGYSLAISNSGGTATINGGTFNGDLYFSKNTDSGVTKSLAIHGGTFNGGFVNFDKGTVVIDGGTFDHDPSAYVAEGYKVTETAGVYTVSQIVNVAQIGETQYESFDEAVAAAHAGDTIVLLDNITFGTDRSVPVWGNSGEQPFNIDLNGHTLTTNSNQGITLSNNGYTASAFCFAFDNEANITVSDGDVKTAYGAGVYVSGQNVHLTLDDVNITQNYPQNVQTTDEYSSAVRITYEANVEINGGTYSGKYSLAVSNSGGYAVINDGTFSSDIFFSDYTSKSYYDKTRDAVKSITINGGTFLGNFVNPDKGSLVIKGGSFASDPTAYLADGYRVTQENDMYVVSAINYVAQIGDNYYETLQAAVDAAETNATAATTITLLSDINLSDTVAIDWTQTSSSKALTIDLAGYNITATDCRALHVKTGYVTIQNNGSKEDGHGIITSVKTPNSSFSQDSSIIRVGSTDTTPLAAATLTINEGVTVSTDYCYGVTVFGNNTGTGNGQYLYVEGTVVATGIMPAISGNGTASLTKTYITVKTNGVVSAPNSYGIYFPQLGSLTVYGTVSGQGGIEMKAGKLVTGAQTVITATGTPSHPGVNNNGTSTSGYAVAIVENNNYKGYGSTWASSLSTAATYNGTFAVVVDNILDTNKKATINVSKGTFGTIGKENGALSTIAVSGGVFDNPVPQDCCADKYEPAGPYSDGKYGVAPQEQYRVASITKNNDTKYYLTTSEAYAAAENGDTIVLVNNERISKYGALISFSPAKTITLDLNGYTLENTNSNYGVISMTNSSSTKQASLTITGNGSLISSKDTIKVGSYSNLTIDEYVIVEGYNGVNIQGTNSVLNTSGTIIAANFGITGNGTSGQGGYQVNVTGGSITSDGIAIYHPNTGTVTISGGIVTGETAVYQKSGILNITGGTFLGNGEATAYQYDGSGAHSTGDAVVIDSCGYPGGAPTASITGGEFISNNAKAVAVYTYNEAPTVTEFITGGIYSDEPDDNYIAAGYEAVDNQDGTWIVQIESHNHVYDYAHPIIAWRNIRGELAAIFTHYCDCGAYVTEIVTGEDISRSYSQGKVTYTAVSEHGVEATTTRTEHYTVTLNDGDPLPTLYQWGDICTLSDELGHCMTWYIDANGNETYDVGETVLADGTPTYTFPVTESIAIRTKESDYGYQKATISATLTSTEANKAVFQAKWSIPTGSIVTSVKVYRGYTTADLDISADTLYQKGIAKTVNMSSINGDYKLNINDLTSGTYQHVIIKITYVDAYNEPTTLSCPVQKVQVQ